MDDIRHIIEQHTELDVSQLNVAAPVRNNWTRKVPHMLYVARIWLARCWGRVWYTAAQNIYQKIKQDYRLARIVHLQQGKANSKDVKLNSLYSRPYPFSLKRASMGQLSCFLSFSLPRLDIPFSDNRYVGWYQQYSSYNRPLEPQQSRNIHTRFRNPYSRVSENYMNVHP